MLSLTIDLFRMLWYHWRSTRRGLEILSRIDEEQCVFFFRCIAHFARPSSNFQRLFRVLNRARGAWGVRKTGQFSFLHLWDEFSCAYIWHIRTIIAWCSYDSCLRGQHLDTAWSIHPTVDGFDPNDPESGSLRNPMLVPVRMRKSYRFNLQSTELQAILIIQYQFFKRIFTAPTYNRRAIDIPL